MSLKNSMPVLARHEGVWDGYYRYYNNQGIKVDEHKTQNITINSKVTGDITFDVNSSWVSKRNMVSDVNCNIDMMGQQMPISAKTTSAITYSY